MVVRYFTAAIGVILFVQAVAALAEDPPPAIDIGSRRELFVDDYLIERLSGAEQKLQTPEARDIALVCDAPWEGNTSAYYTLFQDEDRIRVYYRGAHFDEKTKKAAHPEFACYAESRDGLKFEKPKLGIVEFNGSRDNNIVWSGQGTHNFTVFKDANPACAPEARYKALGRGQPNGLYAFQSADGLHWSLMREKAVITDGAFDSQNLAFWHPERKCYFDFHRKGRNGVRDIMTATSTDFLNWTQPEFLDYGNAPTEHLYTNAIQPYFRAPHLFIGFPTRFQPQHEQVEPVFMTSRDGKRFHRWSEALIPITAPQDRDGNRSNYMTWGLLSSPTNPRELSIYATEAYYAGPGSRVRRFVFRTDGFVAIHAAKEGELLTKPLTFSGRSLELNVRTGLKGRVRVELQTPDGQAIAGYSLDECKPFSGDSIAQTVAWKGGDSLDKLAGKPLRIRFVLEDADLFALRFL